MSRSKAIIYPLINDIPVREFLQDVDRLVSEEAKARLDAMEPTQAILAGYHEAPTSPFLYQLCLVAGVEAYRHSGIATMLIHHIVSGQSLPDDSKTHWEIPVLGITRILCPLSVADHNNDQKDVKLLREIHSSYPMIVEAISKDLSFLQQKGNLAYARKQLLSTMLYLFVTHPEQRPKMYSHTSVRLFLSCWLYSVPCNKNFSGKCSSKLSSSLICLLFDQDDQGHSPPDHCLKVAYQALNIDTFVSRLSLILQSPLDVETLGMEITAMSVFLRNESYHTHIVEAGIHNQIVVSSKKVFIKTAKEKVAGNDPSKKDVPQNNRSALEAHIGLTCLLHCSGKFLCTLIKNSKDGYSLLFDLIRKSPIMEVCAAAIQLLNRNSFGASIRSPWNNVLAMISDLTSSNRIHGRAVSSVPNSREYISDHEILETIKTAIESIAIPVLHSLASESGTRRPDASHSDYADVWRGILHRVGVTEQSIRESYQDQRKCCNAQCPSRKFETCLVLMPKKSRCTGCRSTFYCDRECQIMDWKYHKKECKKMRSASTVDAA
ncbi:hypothetical protein D9613_008583 [Agrocybe pediades]|uniref:MYND-type domain-containing protein n=1 Tax=Agrocybe pediades TaxID=84607 RepID=A0A8H4VP68_9AGAR|nr:hypothetical protein D9613_008583 [Agrocybe pediades]